MITPVLPWPDGPLSGIAPMSPEAIDKVRRLEASLACEPQVEIATDHVLHGGMYARTIRIPAGALLTGVFIKLATVLIVSGRCSVFTGVETVELRGYHVIPASAGRKQAFMALDDTDLTMVFPSRATSVEEAEAEFTNEAHLLFSRKPGAVNHISITGE